MSLAAAHIHGVVLAGGHSSRMGTDKALLPLDGRSLIEHAIGVLHRAGLPVAISGSRTDLSGLAPVLPDLEPSHGPLTGVCSALHALAAPWVVALTVDMPLVPPPLIEQMVEVACGSTTGVVLPSCRDVLFPFPCVLRRDLLDALVCEHRAGRYGCLRAFLTAAAKLAKSVEAVRLELLAETGAFHHGYRLPTDAWLLNINRPADLVQARRWLAI